jgi:7-carboxy-7-deazaguanine synthase
MSDTLVVNEIYLSLQGESTFAGLPCVFIRLTGCNLRCSYCDTAYAFAQGTRRSLEEIIQEVRQQAVPSDVPTPQTGESPAHPTATQLPLVELTGGEPLLQPAALPLMQALCDGGWTVLLETSGAHDISGVDPRVHRIMDLKCPSSGEVERTRWDNLPRLTHNDEIKFVVGSVEDYEWMKSQIVSRGLVQRCPVLVSWVHPLKPEQRDPVLKPVPEGQTPITRRDLVERIIRDALPVRFQLQQHKIIWAPEQRGV